MIKLINWDQNNLFLSAHAGKVETLENDNLGEELEKMIICE